jgi:hypothetical protein
LGIHTAAGFKENRIHRRLRQEATGLRLDRLGAGDGPVDTLTEAQLCTLVAGLDVRGWKKHWLR